MKKFWCIFFLLIAGKSYSQSLCSLIKVYESESSFCSAMAKDNTGAIYAAGRTGVNTIAAIGDTIYNEGMFLTKMDTAGNQIWRTNNIEGPTVTPRNILSDDALNVYVVGNFYDSLKVGASLYNTISAGARNFFIAKYDSSGLLLWIKIDSSTESFIYSATIRNNQLYLTGGFSGSFNYGGATMVSAGGRDICILKLDTSGMITNSLSFGGINNDYGEGIETDTASNIYVCGDYSNSFSISSFSLISHGMKDCFLLKLDAGMNVNWVNTAGSTGEDEFRSLALDSFGHVYAVGRCDYNLQFYPNGYALNNNFYSGFIVKYTTTGTYLKSRVIAEHGNIIQIKMVGNFLVLCGKLNNQGPKIVYDYSMSFVGDGYYVILDSSIYAISIGKFSNATFNYDERSFSISQVGKEKFFVSGFGGIHLAAPDSNYSQISSMPFSQQNHGGFSFIEKICVPHLKVVTSDSFLVIPIYSVLNPLIFNLNLNGSTISSYSSNVDIGYSKTSNNSYLYSCHGNYYSPLVNIPVYTIQNNTPLNSFNFKMNFHFTTKNLMIRSENSVRFCRNDGSFLISGPSGLCQGDTISLTATSGFQNYSWFPSSGIVSSNGGQIDISPIANTVYTVSAENNLQQCFFNSYQINIYNPPSQFTVQQIGNFISVSLYTGYSYQWYLNDVLISGATNHNYQATIPGVYTVLVTNTYGCSTMSHSFFFTSLDNLQIANNVLLFPNPADESFTVSFQNNSSLGKVNMSLINEFGQVMQAWSIYSEEKTATEKINTMALPIGFYFLEIRGNNIRCTKKIAVIH